MASEMYYFQVFKRLLVPHLGVSVSYIWQEIEGGDMTQHLGTDNQNNNTQRRFQFQRQKKYLIDLGHLFINI